MDTIQDLASARRTVSELCLEDTSALAGPQLLQVLDSHIGRARQAGDLMTTNVLQAVRRSLRDKLDTLH